MRPLLTDDDVYLFNEGTHRAAYLHLGAQMQGEGVHFGVWAPNAASVSVIGDFNGWDPGAHPMFPTASGIWKVHVPEARRGQTYKYHLAPSWGGRILKADPYAFHAEVPPKTASVIWDLGYEWGDADWMRERQARNGLDSPMSIYEVHLGSWRKKSLTESLSYRELAEPLADYVVDMGYTHVEFLPIMEHPYYPSWGYQVTGYFAPTSRYGTPQDLMYLIDHLHQRGIGVILDWVPSHFATDPHGLARFDGTALYEHEDPRKGWHPDWQSFVFNYGRNEVRSFLLSSAMFWLDVYHADGLRVDAVASMLYLDYSREPGEWVPNIYGGNENLEAISLLQLINRHAYEAFPSVAMTAEESTAWPGVTKPVDVGGLGFGFKWDMGWMHDTLGYFSHDPIHRAYHQNELTFRMLYAYDENFVLSLSHDEVVHGKGSLVNKMPGDEWQQFANLRALFGYMYGLPGKKLLFMGGEFGQRSEWNIDAGLDWFVTEFDNHAGALRFSRDLNLVYSSHPELWRRDYHPDGFAWVDASDAASSVLSFLRFDGDAAMLVVGHFTPTVRSGYRIGVDRPGAWEVVLNSDATDYWGTGAGSTGTVTAEEIPMHGHPYSVNLDLPPLGVLYVAAPST